MDTLQKLKFEEHQLKKELKVMCDELSGCVNRGDTTSEKFKVCSIAVATVNNRLYAKECEIFNEEHRKKSLTKKNKDV